MRNRVFILLLLSLIGQALAACGDVSQSGLAPGAASTLAPIVAGTRTTAPTATRSSGPRDGFPTVRADALPPEARQTIALIEKGGPFLHRQDGQVFQNREGLLPNEPGGYYHEYTVETPGASDRGARRIITGDDGELYYTDDHYSSFRRIIP